MKKWLVFILFLCIPCVVLADTEEDVYHESRNLYMQIFHNETVAQACFQASSFSSMYESAKAEVLEDKNRCEQVQETLMFLM